MTQLTDKVFAAPVPDKVNDFKSFVECVKNDEADTDIGKFQFLFTTATATEEDARKVVGNGQYDSYGCYNVWSPYGIIDSPYDSAGEALHGLLRSKNLDPKNNFALIEKLKYQ